MNLPPKPTAGQPLSASWAGDVLDYIRAITPRTSPAVRVTTLSGGSVFDLPRGTPSAQPAGGTEADILIDVEWDDTDKKLIKHYRKGRIVWAETEAEAAARELANPDLLTFVEFAL